jgi:hypothetical protein
MSTLPVDVDPQVRNVGELLGILSADGSFNPDWFSRAETELGDLPKRLPQLFTLIQSLLGPAAEDGPPVFDGAQWYVIPNPLNGTPTGLYLVAPKPSKEIASGEVGIGVLHRLGYNELTATASAYVSLFQLSATAEPSFTLGSRPAQLTLRATSDGNFMAENNVVFSAMSLDAEIYFADELPTMRLVFEDLTVGGAPAPASQSTYSTLGELVGNLDTVIDWFAAVILKGNYWLNNYFGTSTYTFGDILEMACVLKEDNNGNYQLNGDYLKDNVGNPKTIAWNFLFNLLNSLADSTTPLIPINVGAPGSGIYIVKEDAGNAGSDFGLRLMIEDISPGGAGSQSENGGGGGQNNNGAGNSRGTGPQFRVQLGKWIAGEDDAHSWVARSLALSSDIPPPGISLYLFQSASKAGDCASAPPALTFAPHLELISLGLDVRGGNDQPLFNVGGCILTGAELRIYLKQVGKSFTFGAAASLDGLGVPLGPQFGQAAGSGSNQIPQSLLSSASGGSGAGEKAPVNPAFSVSAAFVEHGSFVMQLYDQNGAPSDQVIIPIQRAVGPLHCSKLGLGWVQDTTNSSNDRLSLLFDGGIAVNGLAIDLFGLSIGIPVTSPGDFSKYDLDLDGLGITFSSGAVELSAALVKLGPDPQAVPPRNYTEYDGEALLKAGTFAISAVGSYAYVPGTDDQHGYASLFIFAMLDADLGGPAFFYVTGLAAGFGYNRSLILPGQDGVRQFPLVAGASDPTTLGGAPPDPAKALVALDAVVPPERGEYWLAAGVRFTSFDLINSTALLVVEFGNELEIALLGLSWISLPPPAAPGASAPTEKYAYAELALEVKLLPDAGVFSATAVLTPNSFVIDPACHLTGGFAFYVWFGDNPHAGEFVLTIGGYHPDFRPPSYYPQVPRLGFNWPMGGDVTISGDAYFALTPSAVMAGAGLQIIFSSGPLKAWFKAQMDALIEWAPFHYEIDISVSIGVSVRVHLLFVTVTLSFSLGADLNIWGPPMGGVAHIHLYIVSFSVGFGADAGRKPAPLGWANPDGTGFAQTLLPNTSAKSPRAHPAMKAMAGGLHAMAISADLAADDAPQQSGVYSIAVNDGLLKTFKYGGRTVWVVRPNHFAFSATTSFPATEVTVTPAPHEAAGAHTSFTPQDSCQAGSDYFVCIRPMKATLSSSVFNVTLTLDDDETYDLAGDFDFDVSCRAVPAAKWDRPLADGQDPDQSKMLPGRLLGLENIKPKAATLTPSGADALTIDVKTAFADIAVDAEDPYSPDHLPLKAGSAPVGPVPQADAQALDAISKALKDAAVTKARADVFAALQGYGIDPVTNGALDIYAGDPAAVLTGNPLLISTSA